MNVNPSISNQSFLLADFQKKKTKSRFGNQIVYRKFANSFFREECLIYCTVKCNYKSN